MIAANRYAGSTNGRIKIFNHPERLPIGKKALASIKMAANAMITVNASIIFDSREVNGEIYWLMSILWEFVPSSSVESDSVFVEL